MELSRTCNSSGSGTEGLSVPGSVDDTEASDNCECDCECSSAALIQDATSELSAPKGVLSQVFEIDSQFDARIPGRGEQGESLPYFVQRLLSGEQARTPTSIPGVASTIQPTYLVTRTLELLHGVNSVQVPPDRSVIAGIASEVEELLILLAGTSSDIAQVISNGVTRASPPLSASRLLSSILGSPNTGVTDQGSTLDLSTLLEANITFLGNVMAMTGRHQEWFDGLILCGNDCANSPDCDLVFCPGLSLAFGGVPAWGECVVSNGKCFCVCIFEDPIPFWRRMVLALLVLIIVCLIAFIIAQLVIASWPAIVRAISALIAAHPELAALLAKLLELIKGILFGGGKVPNPT